ncbi:trigger factor [Flavobacteriaceae bacterium]|nr:trigger factor [Flavobacteriaceae bacterium]
MKISKKSIGKQHSLISVQLIEKDYSEKVNDVLVNYSKTANMPGFRKGHIPLGLVKKQYGKAIIVDEVNKIIQEELRKYLVSEKLDILGSPLPVSNDDIDWNSGELNFDFEIGLTPVFDINLKFKKPVTSYTITADDKMINDQITNIQNQYGKLISKKEISKLDEITALFVNKEEEINNKFTFKLDKIKSKLTAKSITGLKVGDKISVNTKDLFENQVDLVSALKVTTEKAENLKIEIELSVEEINFREPADLDIELFDKLFGKEVVKTVTELKKKIAEDAEKQFVQQSDQKLLNDVTEYLIDNTKFILPSEFLHKWMQNAGEKELSLVEAKAEYEKSEKSMRYQLIEGKIITENKLQVNMEDVKTYTKEMIINQMLQYGQANPGEKELQDIVTRVLSNQDEVKRISEQLTSQKILSFFKENVNLKAKKLSYEKFVKEVYGA